MFDVNRSFLRLPMQCVVVREDVEIVVASIAVRYVATSRTG